MKKNTRNIVLLVLFLAVIIGLRLSGVGHLLTFENLQKNKDALLAYVQDNAVTSILIYILVYIAAIALNLPGGAVLTIAGGFLFGTLPAVVYVNIGATTGAVLAFLSARYLLGSRIQESYSDPAREVQRGDGAERRTLPPHPAPHSRLPVLSRQLSLGADAGIPLLVHLDHCRRHHPGHRGIRLCRSSIGERCIRSATYSPPRSFPPSCSSGSLLLRRRSSDA